MAEAVVVDLLDDGESKSTTERVGEQLAVTVDVHEYGESELEAVI